MPLVRLVNYSSNIDILYTPPYSSNSIIVSRLYTATSSIYNTSTTSLLAFSFYLFLPSRISNKADTNS